MGGDELLRSVARFQREMLRKREEQGVKLAKEPKSLEEKGGNLLIIYYVAVSKEISVAVMASCYCN